MGNVWSRDEVQILVKHYPNLESRRMSSLLARSPKAIRNKAARLQLRAQSRNHSYPKIVSSLEASPSLAYLAGAILGDGYIYKKKNGVGYFVGFNAKDYEFIRSVQDAFVSVIGKRPKARLRRNGKSYIYGMLVSNKTLYTFLSQPLKSLVERLKPYECEFVRGFYDAEGSFSTLQRRRKKWQRVERHVSFYNTNRELIECIRDLLLANGIHPSPKLYMSVGNKGRTQKPCYILRIQRKDSVLLFGNLIIPSIPRKRIGGS